MLALRWRPVEGEKGEQKSADHSFVGIGVVVT